MTDPFVRALRLLTSHPDWAAQPERVRERAMELVRPDVDAHRRANEVRDLLADEPSLVPLWKNVASLDRDGPAPDRFEWPGGVTSRPPLLRWRCPDLACIVVDYGDAYAPYRFEVCPTHGQPLERASS